MTEEEFTLLIDKFFRFRIQPAEAYVLDYQETEGMLWSDLFPRIKEEIDEITKFESRLSIRDFSDSWRTLESSLEEWHGLANSGEYDSEEEFYDALIGYHYNVFGRSLSSQDAGPHTITLEIDAISVRDLRYIEIQKFMEYFCDYTKTKNLTIDFKDAVENYILLCKEPIELGVDFSSSYEYKRVSAFYRFQEILSIPLGNAERKHTLPKFLANWQRNVHSNIDDCRKKFIDEYQALNDEQKRLRKAIDTWREETEERDLQWQEAREAEYLALKNTYEEKLKFDESKKLWDSAAETQRNLCRFWSGMVIVVALLLVGAGAFVYKYFDLSNPDSKVGFFPSMLTFAAISLMIYILRMFVKIALSAKHLQNSYEQKSTMTYFYLALAKESEEGELKEAERLLALQSIFTPEVLRFWLTGKTIRWKDSCYASSLSSGVC